MFTKFYFFYLWTLFVTLMCIWTLSIVNIPQELQAQEAPINSGVNNCKELEEENISLRSDIERLKLEKFEVSFTNCKNICKRLQ